MKNILIEILIVFLALMVALALIFAGAWLIDAFHTIQLIQEIEPIIEPLAGGLI